MSKVPFVPARKGKRTLVSVLRIKLPNSELEEVGRKPNQLADQVRHKYKFTREHAEREALR